MVGLALGRGPVSAEEDSRQSARPRRLDPSAWGSDHVGKRVPEYVTGDECLFCHRNIGPTWPDNRHQLTIRPATADDPAVTALREFDIHKSIADQVSFILGDVRTVRLLKRSQAFGKLDLFSAKYLPPSEAPKRSGGFANSESPHWDTNTFGERCAGCHSTAVDTPSRAFFATSIDCFACHGSVDLAHTGHPKLVLLSKKNREPREVISICGQCHLRGGKSKSSGLPYPNTFVAGDNLFRDFLVDLSADAISKLSPIDRHIFENSHDVVVFGRTETTCLSCHDVHNQSSERHQELNESRRCTTCHVPGSDHTELTESFLQSRGPSAHSQVCEY
jgi:hypothetical protein